MNGTFSPYECRFSGGDTLPYAKEFELFALIDNTETKISHTTACTLVCSGRGDTKPNILIVIMQL